MLIHQVALTNFKSYAQAGVDFSPGTVAIVGPNGAGKSSLLDAIGLVLFDCQRGTYAERLREGARKGSVRVRLSSSLDGRAYDVTRDFSDRATTRYVVADVELDGRVVAEGADQVTTWLREHLRVEPSPGLSALFQTTIGVEQGTCTAPFLLPASSRKAQFDPLLQVDAYRAAYDALRPTQRHLTDIQQAMARVIARMEGQLEDLPQRQKRLEAIQNRLAALASKIDSYEQAIAVKEPHVTEMAALQRAAQESEALARQAEREVQHQEQRLAQARDAVQQAQIAQDTLQQSEKGHRAYLAADAHLTELEEQRIIRDALGQKHTHHQTNLARLLERAKAAKQTLIRSQKAQAQVEALQPQVEEQERLEMQLRAAEERAHSAVRLACQIVDLERQVAGEAAALEALRAEAEHAAKLAEERAQVEQELASLSEQRSALAAEIARHRARAEQIAEQTATLQDASADCPTCEQPLPEGRRQKLLARNAEERNALQHALAEATKHVSKLGRQEHLLKEHLNQLEAALRESPSAREIAGAEERHAASATALERARRDKAQLGDTTAALAELRSALELLGDPRAEQHVALRAADDSSAATDTLASAQAALAKTQEQIQALERSLAQYEGLDETIAHAHAERERCRAEHEAYLRAQQLAQTLPQAQSNLAEMQDGLEKTSARRDAAVRAAAQAVAAYDADAHQRILQELLRAREALAATHAQSQSLEEQSDQLVQEIEALERLQGELAAQRTRLDESRATSDLLTYLRTLLRDAGPLVTQRLIRRISHQAAEFYAELMGQSLGRLVWGEDYGLYLDLGDEQRSYDQLSGGERMAAALAVRMALLRETSAVDVAFFDEPTAHLDSERRESLAERLMGVRGFSQFFVISHDDTFEQAAQSYVRVWRDADGSHVLS